MAQKPNHEQCPQQNSIQATTCQPTGTNGASAQGNDCSDGCQPNLPSDAAPSAGTSRSTTTNATTKILAVDPDLTINIIDFQRDTVGRVIRPHVFKCHFTAVSRRVEINGQRK